MRKKQSICLSVAIMLAFISVISLIYPINAEAKGAYYSVDLFTSDRSKKGTQSFLPTEVVDTSNIFVNAYMETSFPKDDKSDIAGFTKWEFEGETYYFKVPEGLYSTNTIYENIISKDYTVTVQLMLRYEPGKERLIEPSARAYKDYAYYSPNMSEASVVKEYRAYMDYLTELFSKSQSHIDAWVCGNEVNAPDCWNFFGSDCMSNVSGKRWVVSNSDLLMEKYSKFYDIVYDAVKSKNNKARVCICVDHCWTESDGGKIIPTKTFLNKFAEKEGNSKDWCIAFHCYPADLYQTAIWSSPYNPKNENAQFVDGYNLEILTGYVKSNFGSNHRIMLTEQGFSDSQGVDKQAACLVYTFYKARFDDMIDVMHIMKFPGCGFELREPAATIWTYLDDGSDEHEQWIFNQVSGTIGISSWYDITPNWKSQGSLKAAQDNFKKNHPCMFGGIDYSPVFDFDYYVANNPTVVGYYTLDPVSNPPKFEDMFWYFSRYGMDMGQKSSPNFDLEKYKGEHPELVAIYGEDNRAYYTHYCSLIMEATTTESVEQVKAFVKRFYKEILGREAEEDGINYWTNILVNKEQTGAQVASGFIHSPEFMEAHYSDDIVVAKMYDAFFDRKPGPEEYQYWMDKFIDGFTLEQVLSGFTDSGEFQALCDKYGIERGSLGYDQSNPQGQPRQLKFGSRDNLDDAKLTEYVTRMYTKALDRKEVSQAEIDYWKSTIIAGQDASGKKYDPASVASDGFLNSNEYIGRNRTDEEFVYDCYQAFFDRTPGQIESDYWLDRMHNKGYSRKRVVLEGFGVSGEFQNLLKTYGFEIME